MNIKKYTQTKYPKMNLTRHELDDEWDNFIHHREHSSEVVKSLASSVENAPECDDLYISTKTKVLFLNQKIDIHEVFWKIPVLPYWEAKPGVVKKQMKIVSKTPEEFEQYKARLSNIPYYTENIIKQIDNPTARRMKFEDERKITIGVSKKDIMNCRGKVKNAFYNYHRLPIERKAEA